MGYRPIVCALLAAVISPAAFADIFFPFVPDTTSADANGILFRDNFELAETGEFPIFWEIGCGKPSIAPDAGDKCPRLASHNKLLKLTPGDYVFRMFDRPTTGIFEVQFDYLTPAEKNGLLLVTLGDFDKTRSDRRRTSYCMGDVGVYMHWMGGSIAYYTEQEQWTRFARWEQGVWNHARVVIDVGVGLFDFYGADSTRSGVFRHRQKKASGIGLRHHGTTGIVYIDNVVVNAIHD